jgi:hypothetical protein
MINEDKLDLVEGIVGAFDAIFMIKVWYLDKTCLIGLIVEIHVVLMFHRILPLISMIFISMVNSKCFLGL